MSIVQQPDRNLALELTRVTEAAAMAAGRWVGRGDKNSADGAAVEAMRHLISSISMNGVVVIGEGEKDEAPMLYNGERIGDGVRAEHRTIGAAPDQPTRDRGVVTERHEVGARTVGAVAGDPQPHPPVAGGYVVGSDATVLQRGGT